MEILFAKPTSSVASLFAVVSFILAESSNDDARKPSRESLSSSSSSSSLRISGRSILFRRISILFNAAIACWSIVNFGFGFVVFPAATSVAAPDLGARASGRSESPLFISVDSVAASSDAGRDGDAARVLFATVVPVSLVVPFTVVSPLSAACALEEEEEDDDDEGAETEDVDFG